MTSFSTESVMNSISKLMVKFFTSLFTGLSDTLLGDPIVQWDSPLVQLVTAISALFAIIGIVMKINNTREFGSEALKFAFWLYVVMAIYGQVNYFSLLNFGQLKSSYDGSARSGSNRTLDRDLFNYLLQTFNRTIFWSQSR